MGNRAMITTKDRKIGVYLHWNGGRDSVVPMLEYCRLRGFAPFESPYGMARFIQVVSNFFGGTNSIGIEADIRDEDAEYFDNGIYIVEGWDIVDRVFTGEEQKSHKMIDMLKVINKTQPKSEQTDERFFDCPIVPTSEIQVGEWVYILDPIYGKYEEYMVMGIGKDKMVNGMNVKGIPYVDCYATNNENNPNSYLTEAEYRVLRRACGAGNN